MECVDFMQPRWPSRISTFNSIFCRSFRFGTRESVGPCPRAAVVPYFNSTQSIVDYLPIEGGASGNLPE